MDEVVRALVQSWLTKAANDLATARILGAAPDGPLDTAIYHCQQAAEKAVKAFLVAHGMTPEKTHDVEKLVLRAAAIAPEFSQWIQCAAILTPYAWEFRYPDDLGDIYPTRDEFDEARNHAQSIFDFVLGLIPTEAHPK